MLSAKDLERAWGAGSLSSKNCDWMQQVKMRSLWVCLRKIVTGKASEAG